MNNKPSVMKYLVLGTIGTVGSWAIGMPTWFTVISLVLTVICVVGAFLGIREP